MRSNLWWLLAVYGLSLPPPFTGLPFQSNLVPRSPLPTDLSLPQYVLDYAPILYLSSQESYWPSSLTFHLEHVTPKENSSGVIITVPDAPDPLTLTNLNDSSLNSVFVYLTSNDDPTSNPSWLQSVYGKPDANSQSAGDAVIIVVDKSDIQGPGWVDAFYFYWYSYNLGPDVFGENFGNHVGDWEHSMVRFNNGQPTAVYVSEHDAGAAFTYDCLEKEGARPVLYAGVGDHAVYVTPGTHNYSGVSFLVDETDKGVRWDVTLNFTSYWYQSNTSFVPTTGRSNFPPEFLIPVLKWGDQSYALSDPRQQEILGFLRWDDGPTGPVDKLLNRTSMGPTPDLVTQSSLPPVVSSSASSAASAAAGTNSAPAPVSSSLYLGPILWCSLSFVYFITRIRFV